MNEDEMSNGEIRRTLDRIENKLNEVTGDHEKRLRKLEAWVYFAAGSGVLGAGAGLSAWFGG